ncbi:hypothetical protein C8Q80DRAFT_367481 [Daedaleopsis nitida]|nr:hypothetical protein C8Q80DRAFT_367481 [Daedaleopsis nitida]
MASLRRPRRKFRGRGNLIRHQHHQLPSSDPHGQLCMSESERAAHCRARRSSGNEGGGRMDDRLCQNRESLCACANRGRRFIPIRQVGGARSAPPTSD